jgi:hypothetical protein
MMSLSAPGKMLNIAHFKHVGHAAGFILRLPAVFTNSEQK